MTRTVLLVDDEVAVRSLVRIAFERAGWNVLEATDGEEAILTSRQHLGEISLLVTDLHMPGMGGEEVADHLLGTRPELRVLFLSGLVQENLTRSWIAHAGTGFLHKPFSLAALQSAVAELMDAPRPAEVVGA